MAASRLYASLLSRVSPTNSGASPRGSMTTSSVTKELKISSSTTQLYIEGPRYAQRRPIDQPHPRRAFHHPHVEQKRFSRGACHGREAGFNAQVR